MLKKLKFGSAQKYDEYNLNDIVNEITSSDETGDDVVFQLPNNEVIKIFLNDSDDFEANIYDIDDLPSGWLVSEIDDFEPIDGVISTAEYIEDGVLAKESIFSFLKEIFDATGYPVYSFGGLIKDI